MNGRGLLDDFGGLQREVSGPIGIGFIPDGRRMYVSDVSDSIGNTFAVASDGNLTLIQTQPSGAPSRPFHAVNVLPTPSEKDLAMNNHRRAALRAAAGILTTATLVLSGPATAVADPGRASTGPDAAHPSGRTVYVTNSARDGGDANVARFAVGNAGALTPVETMAAGAGARGMAFTPDLRFAYLSASAVNQVEMYRIGRDGALTRFGAVEIPSPRGIAIAPNGRTLYVGNSGTRMVSVFAVRSDGGLTLRQRVDTGAEATQDVALTPDGRFLYVSHGMPTGTERTVMTGFALGPDGSVGRDVARVKIGVGGAENVITPDGRFVYVVHEITNDVYGFRIGRDGGLSPVPGSPVGGGNWLEGAAVSPDGHRLYVAAVGVDNSDPENRDPDTVPGQVLGFTIGNDGRLTENIDRIDMASPIGIGFTPDGRRMYVSDFTDSIVNTFAVAPDGNLTLVQTVKSGGLQPAFQSMNVLPTRSGRTSG